MLKAGSLIYTVVISLIIAMLLGSIILYKFYSQLQFLRLQRQGKLIDNVQSGFNMLYSDTTFQTHESILDLYGEGTDSIYLKKFHWGVFELGIVKAFQQNDTLQKAALIGDNSDLNDSTALYLADHQMALSLSGETVIKGDCFLPQIGAKAGFVENKSFKGNKLINGKTSISSPQLPAINQNLKKLVEETSDFHYWKDKHSATIDLLADIDSINHSFTGDPLIIYENNSIVLEGKKITGQVVISSSVGIKVKANTNLEDVLLIAPKIEIEDGFTGSIQAFASDSITIGKKCSLNYPSSLILETSKSTLQQAAIVIDENSTLQGVIIASGDRNNIVKSYLNTSSGIKISGQVYINGYLMLNHGSVLGKVYADRFLLKTPSSISENQLLDVVIDRSKLNRNFVGISLLKAPSITSQTIKWLH